MWDRFTRRYVSFMPLRSNKVPLGIGVVKGGSRVGTNLQILKESCSNPRTPLAIRPCPERPYSTSVEIKYTSQTYALRNNVFQVRRNAREMADSKLPVSPIAINANMWHWLTTFLDLFLKRRSPVEQMARFLGWASRHRGLGSVEDHWRCSHFSSCRSIFLC